MAVWKASLNLADAMAEDVGEAEQDRQLDAALLRADRRVLQVDGLFGMLVGMDGDMARSLMPK